MLYIRVSLLLAFDEPEQLIIWIQQSIQFSKLEHTSVRIKTSKEKKAKRQHSDTCGSAVLTCSVIAFNAYAFYAYYSQLILSYLRYGLISIILWHLFAYYNFQ